MDLPRDQLFDDQAVGAFDPEKPGLDPQRLVAGLGIREEYSADDQIVLVPDEIPELLAFDLDIHLGLGKEAVFDFGIMGLKLVQSAEKNVQVVDDSVAVAEKRSDGISQAPDEKVFFASSSQVLTFSDEELRRFLHPVVVLERDFEFFGDLVVAGFVDGEYSSP